MLKDPRHPVKFTIYYSKSHQGNFSPLWNCCNRQRTIYQWAFLDSWNIFFTCCLHSLVIFMTSEVMLFLYFNQNQLKIDFKKLVYTLYIHLCTKETKNNSKFMMFIWGAHIRPISYMYVLWMFLSLILSFSELTRRSASNTARSSVVMTSNWIHFKK